MVERLDAWARNDFTSQRWALMGLGNGSRLYYWSSKTWAHRHPALNENQGSEITMSINACNFLLVVSIWDLVSEVDDRLIPSREFSSFLDHVSIDIDPVRLCNFYIDQIKIGEGDVLLLRSSADSSQVLVFDLFRDKADQLDLVSIGFICSLALRVDAGKLLFRFFNSCSTQISFSANAANGTLRDLVNESNYPRAHGTDGYAQQLMCTAP